MTLAELEARFSARGRWRERLPTILDTLAALGRARPLAGASGGPVGSADEAPRWAAA
ncbi:MAG TPA: hypothetical protein P5163_01460 [Rubrivivax sp.]|nr:hypothetical protein [Rubrivivax sp.]HRY88153.1 hypothetical protein [Rubrivivax sp.]HRZ59231.1 hypothetical protein [Rubrivivax sp.]